MRGDLQAARHKLREEIRANETDHEADHDQAHAMAGDQAQDITGLRAERHPHADLLGALPDGISHHAIQADRGEEERERGENREQVAEEFALPKGLGDDYSMVWTR